MGPQLSTTTRRDAEQLCRDLFPHHTEEALQLEVSLLLMEAGPRHRRPFGPSCLAVRAEGNRAKIKMVRCLLTWIEYVFGKSSVPDVSLSLTPEEIKVLERKLGR